MEAVPMRRLEIPDVETFIAAIQDEISRTPEGRYYHRLHVTLHALKTGDCYEAAHIYEHSPRSVYNWVHRLSRSGLAGLSEGKRPGRPRRLSPSQEQKLYKDLLLSPRELGHNQNIWDGPLLSYHLEKQYAVHLRVRQCQNVLHRLGFTLQRPRRQAAEADPEKQEAFKKNSKNG
jgi:transposase